MRKPPTPTQLRFLRLAAAGRTVEETSGLVTDSTPAALPTRVAICYETGLLSTGREEALRAELDAVRQELATLQAAVAVRIVDFGRPFMGVAG